MDYLPRCTTMNEQLYTDLLLSLRESIKEKHRDKLRHGSLLQQDNPPVHTRAKFLYALCAIVDSNCCHIYRIPGFRSRRSFSFFQT